jgi:hypothetical protein
VVEDNQKASNRETISLGELRLPKEIVAKFNQQYKLSAELDEKLQELAELAKKNRERVKSANEEQIRKMYAESIEQIVPAISEGVRSIKAINDLALDLQKSYAVSITSTSKYNRVALTIAAVTLVSTLLVSIRSCQVAVSASDSSEQQLNRVTAILDASLSHERQMAQELAKIASRLPVQKQVRETNGVKR